MLPTSEIGNDPIALRDYAQAVEDLGYSHLLAYDHVLGALHEGRDRRLWGPYTENDPFHEPFVLFGYLAATTSRIELGTAVLVLPQRQTALVAKQAVEINLLSGGRLRLGVGLGWNYVEYEALGTDFESRASRLSEQIDVLRTLWREPIVDFEGKHHRIDRAALVPKPATPIPIWCGGGTLPSLRRAARLADGYLFGASGPSVFDLALQAPQLVADAGRSADDFGLEAIVDFADGPAAWEDVRQRWGDAGGTHLSIRAISTGAKWMRVTAPNFTSLDEHIGALEQFAKTCF